MVFRTVLFDTAAVQKPAGQAVRPLPQLGHADSPDCRADPSLWRRLKTELARGRDGAADLLQQLRQTGRRSRRTDRLARQPSEEAEDALAASSTRRGRNTERPCRPIPARTVRTARRPKCARRKRWSRHRDTAGAARIPVFVTLGLLDATRCARPKPPSKRTPSAFAHGRDQFRGAVAPRGLRSRPGSKSGGTRRCSHRHRRPIPTTCSWASPSSGRQAY